MSEREVLFTLKPRASQDAGKVFADFAAMGERANDRIAASHKTAADRAASEWDKLYNRMGMAAGKAYAGATTAAEKAARDHVSATEQMVLADTKAGAAREKTSQKATSASKAEQQMDRDAAKLKSSLMTAQDQHNARVGRYKELLDASKISQDQYGKAVEQSQKRVDAALSRTAAAEEASRKRDEAERKRREREIEGAYSKAERAQAQVGAATMAASEGFKMAMGGATALARGFALLGAASEKDLEKAIRTLAKVEAGVQAVRGTVDLIQGSVKVWKAYGAAVEAAAAAHVALTAAQALSAGTGAASAGRGASRGIAGAAGNVVGSGVAGAIGARLMGAGAGAAEAGVAEAAGAGVAGGSAFTVGAGLSAALSMLSMGIAGGQTVRDAWKYGFGRGGEPKTYASWIANAETGAFDWTAGLLGFDPYGTRAASKREQQAGFQEQYDQAQTDRVRREMEMQADIESQRRDRLYQRQVLEDQTGIEAMTRRRQAGATSVAFQRQAELERQRPDMVLATDEEKMRYQLAGSRAEMEAMQRQRDLAAWSGYDQSVAAQGRAGVMANESRQRLAAAQSRMAGAATPEGRAAAEGELSTALRLSVEAEQRLLQATQDRKTQEEAIANTRRQSADENIARTRDEISLRQGLIDQERQRLMSAQERIAAMNPAQQAELVRVWEKVKANPGAATAEEYGTLGALRGLRPADPVLRAAAEARSRETLGRIGVTKDSEEYKAKLQAEIDRLNVTVKDQRELRINLERDDSDAINRAAAAIIEQFRQYDRTFEESLTRKLQEGFAQIRQETEQKLRQLGAQRLQSVGR